MISPPVGPKFDARERYQAKAHYRFAKACIASKNVNGGEWIDVVPDTSIEWPRNRSPQLRHDGIPMNLEL